MPGVESQTEQCGKGSRTKGADSERKLGRSKHRQGVWYGAYIFHIISQFWGYPNDWTVKNPLAMQKTQETRVSSLGQEDPLEEEMATPSNILAWKIPWTEEPGGPSPKGYRVRHNWATEKTHLSFYRKYCLILQVRKCDSEKLTSIWRHIVTSGGTQVRDKRKIISCKLIDTVYNCSFLPAHWSTDFCRERRRT